MEWLIGISIVIIILVVIIIITKIRITVDYRHEGDDDSLRIKISAWRVLSYTYEVPSIAVDEDTPSLLLKKEKQLGKNEKKESRSKITLDDILSRMKETQRLLGKIEGLHKIIKRFLRRVAVSNVQWHTQFGLGDAALTGTASGAVWMLKGNIIGLIGHFTDLKNAPKLSVQPLFQVAYSQMSLSCMISFRIGHAMRAGLQIVKFWKGRQPSCQKNIQSRA
jgi:hypothetical protein